MFVCKEWASIKKYCLYNFSDKIIKNGQNTIKNILIFSTKYIMFKYRI